MDSKSNDWYPLILVIRRRADSRREQDIMWRRRQRLEWCRHKPRNAGVTRSRRKQRRISPRDSRERRPAGTLASDFWFTELWENRFLVFWTTQCVAACHSSQRKEIRKGQKCTQTDFGNKRGGKGILYKDTRGCRGSQRRQTQAGLTWSKDQA